MNFALFSEHGTVVEVCLFNRVDGEETARVALVGPTKGVWHGYLPGLGPGQLYGFRVDGPFQPQLGHRFNPHKLLIDPYAKAIAGQVAWHDAVYDCRLGESPPGAGPLTGVRGSDLAADRRDSAPFVPKAMVIETAFDWGDDRPPSVPWERTVIYECHVKGMTARHPDVTREYRGTYLGMASPPIIEHLRKLGVTALELLPVQQCIHRRRLVDKLKVNYWGYDTIGFFAPDSRLATGDDGRQVIEFKQMVKALHRAGLEVILDVVLNHTAEGDEHGPTLCLRGIDNSVYYHLDAADPSVYRNYTGCGNTLNLDHPQTLRLVMDSLRYWVEDMHVDGFRFDLTTALTRDRAGVPGTSSFLAAVHDDPIVSRVKLIAEPWDAAPDGYRGGSYPADWAEWNDRYRDTVRRFWAGNGGQLAGLAYRLSGSSDVFAASGRGPLAAINFVTSHDGFTLHDLVSFERKHNADNGEYNRDGCDANHSRNWGIEGPTDDPEIMTLRERVKRSLLAMAAFSLGVPMITAGDEMGRTQHGNNNAYCQDNATSWVDWDLDEARQHLLAFVADILRLRRETAVFRRSDFFDGDTKSSRGIKDVAWLRPEGGEMALTDWDEASRHSLGMLVHNAEDDSMLLLLLNGGEHRCSFRLPEVIGRGNPHPALSQGERGSPHLTSLTPARRGGGSGTWRLLVDTSLEGASPAEVGDDVFELQAHTLALLNYEPRHC